MGKKKQANVFWDTIREARALVEKGSKGNKRKRHEQKKKPPRFCFACGRTRIYYMYY